MSSLSYVEKSTLNDVCSGKSETLQILIEQEPNELLNIVLPKKPFQLQEPLQFEFNGDPRYHYKSWNFGNGETVDSVNMDSPVKYLYKCLAILK